MSSWHTVTLSGSSQVIPPVCPNCLAPADVQVETEHRFLNTTYTQTFLYCKDCAKAAADLPSIFFWGILGLVVGFVPALLFVFVVFPKLPESLKDSSLSGAFPLLALAVCAVGFPLLRRLSFKKSHPKTGKQAVQGPAAYYTGPGDALGLGDSSSYKAARPEWISELVRRNQDQADPATRHLWTGAPPAKP
ncbi:MAG: hypothetical protein HY924_11000 [Elusimicrobia bacterium]|nr:hypothetical protein [Elusimicrobiota bacterium]